ncbi:hypothetical protein EJ08DRAFT_518780 [Tothia fuscella]|uniref:C2H2-type domain-containing protein n=1 Tax=Tothia fuscella TaxID=1048955 RepID=A0A9P4NH43_9PEZI|nr:hypothetical protein EJ08DRAFT_518780 [Tothia fuscella]
MASRSIWHGLKTLVSGLGQEAGTLPTPVSTPTPSTGTPNHKRSTSGPGLVAVKPITLEYIYSEKRTVIVKGLRCVICEREYLHLDRLKQHFEIWHNENYTVLQEGEQNIKIIVEDEPRGRGLRAKKRTNLWEKDTSCERLFIAPNKPFDIKRSLRDRAVARQEEEDEEEDQDEDQDETALADGEDSGGEDSAESEEKMNGSQDSSVGTPSVECVTRVAQPVKRRPKTPENDIMQIPIRQRRKVAVPRNPPDKGAQPSRYFTATTKRFLEPGELLSESDDEYPMDWSQEASNDAISKRTDLSEAAKEFHKSMDAHLTTENVIADLYLGDAIIRWLEKPSSRSIISKDDGRAAFLDWLYEVQNFVKPTDFRHCIDTVSRALPLGRRSRALSSATHISDSEMMDEEVSAVGGAELGANNQDKEQRKLEHCKCGQIANSIADCISCCNDDCAFPDYHLDCVALTDYQIGWRCQNCIS